MSPAGRVAAVVLVVLQVTAVVRAEDALQPPPATSVASAAARAPVDMVALPPRWPDEIVRYTIDARLDTSARQIAGRETVSWVNTTSQPATDLWFHLYQNAYKSAETTFLREAPDYVERIGDRWGWIEIRSLRLQGPNGVTSGDPTDVTSGLQFVRPDDGNENDFTVARVQLPAPVEPGASLTFEIEFVTQLIPAADRTGYHDEFYFVGQWFPKLGVFQSRRALSEESHGVEVERASWNCHQYHGASEYFSDFGTYDVTVTLPRGYVYGSTGAVADVRENADGTTSIRAYQEHVHDFAWTADPDFLPVERTFRWRERVTDEELARAAEVAGIGAEQVGLKDVTVRLLLRPEHKGQTDRHLEAIYAALEHYGLRYGAYPYDQITIVDPSFGGRSVGGMEYPTLVTAGTSLLAPEGRQDPESVIVHEIGHQWWQGMAASNEFEESWLDEGINSYCEESILQEVYGANEAYERILGVPVPGARLLTVALPRFPFYGVGGIPVGPIGRPLRYNGWMASRASYLEAPTADPMLRPSWLYRDRASYGINSYAKPAAMLHGLERRLGLAAMTRALRAYQLAFRFKHPTTEDFIDTFGEAAPGDVTDYLQQTIRGSGLVDFAVGKVEGGDGKPVSVVVERRGDLRGAVALRVRFEGGSEEFAKWDGQERWSTLGFAGTGKVESVEVDPYGWYTALDADLANNVSAPEDTVSEARWSVESLYWFQNVLFELALLS